MQKNIVVCTMCCVENKQFFEFLDYWSGAARLDLVIIIIIIIIIILFIERHIQRAVRGAVQHSKAALSVIIDIQVNYYF